METNKKGKNWVGKSLKELKDKYGPAAGEAFAAELEKAGEYETNPLLPENKDLWPVSYTPLTLPTHLRV